MSRVDLQMNIISRFLLNHSVSPLSTLPHRSMSSALLIPAQYDKKLGTACNQLAKPCTSCHGHRHEKKEPLRACREWCIYVKKTAPAKDPLNHCHLWPSPALLLRPRVSSTLGLWIPPGTPTFTMHICGVLGTDSSHHTVYKPQYTPICSVKIFTANYRPLSSCRLKAIQTHWLPPGCLTRWPRLKSYWNP